MRFTIAQQKTLASLPKVTGFMSMVGSGFIILEILRDRKKLNQIYHRLMLGMASIDFFCSFFMAMSTWFAPRESGIVFASGNYATCKTQAFFVMLAVSVPGYNLALAIYYLQVIGYGKRERHLRRFELTMHCLVLAFGFGTSIVGVALNLYHPTWLWCTIAPNPAGGENYSHWYLWGFVGIPVWIAIFAITCIMVWVVVLVRRQEKKVRKWRHGSNSAAEKLTKQVVSQAFWYSISFYVTWTFPTIARVMHAIHGTVPFGVLAVHAFLLPSQGLMNFWVYIRPRYERYKRQHPDSNIFALTGRTISKTALFWRRGAEDDARDDMNPALDIGMLNTTKSDVHESRWDYLRSAPTSGARCASDADRRPEESARPTQVEECKEEVVESVPADKLTSSPPLGVSTNAFNKDPA